MLKKATTLLLCCIVIGVIAKYPLPPTYKDHFYPLKTFFIRTSDVEPNRMSHKLLQGRTYHDFLEVQQIRSRACYGWNVVLKVTTDDTHFFNAKAMVWPTQPKFEWISNTLNNDLSSIYYIHYATYTLPPHLETGEEKGKLAMNDLYCDTTSISVNLRDINDDDRDDNNREDRKNNKML